MAEFVKHSLNEAAMGRIQAAAKTLENLRQELILTEQVRDVVSPVDDPDPAHRIAELNPTNRMAYVDASIITGILEKVIKSVGMDAVLGMERFFVMPYWWVFRCEKADGLRASLKWMKAGGFVMKFEQESNRINAEDAIRKVMKKVLAKGAP